MKLTDQSHNFILAEKKKSRKTTGVRNVEVALGILVAIVVNVIGQSYGWTAGIVVWIVLLTVIKHYLDY